MRPPRSSWKALSLIALAALPVGVLGGDVISTDGFSTCVDNGTITVETLDISYDRSTQIVTFDVAGSSSEEQNVTATITVTAYGRSVYTKTFRPCDAHTYVKQLCPVPQGSYSASGQYTVPDEYASSIPSIAFSVPDLDGSAKLQLFSDSDESDDLACIESSVTNGQSMSVPAVAYVAAGIAGSALALSASAGFVGGFHVGPGHTGAGAPSPTFGEVFGFFQGVAVNGMMSVSYPTVYQSFTKNFAFSSGLIRWGSMQTAIDNFRSKTGGNLTDDSYEYLKNATLIYSNGANSSSASTVLKRSLLFGRDAIKTSTNSTSAAASNGTTSSGTQITQYVHGIQAYVEQLSIPQANTFMTVLLIFAIIVAAITVGILLFKVILEGFAMAGKLSPALESFRKRYWMKLAKTLTNLILVLYGVWTLYCVYQFTNGDSWAAKLLAAVSWTIFTGVLVFFTVKICIIVRKLKKMEGDESGLYQDKETWIKYSLFYDSFKKGYWWLFIPSIVYMFLKNAIVAGFNGHGLAQSIGQGLVEVAMLGLLLWKRPYTLKSGNWINITIQVVRVISVICVLTFVEELGISQTTKTVTGVILIVVQGVLTGVLAILIAVNSIIACVRMNPHRKARKEAEKLNRDLDDLTPLDARNSLLMDSRDAKGEHGKVEMVSPSLHTMASNDSRYDLTKEPSLYGGYEIPSARSSYEMAQRPESKRDDSRSRLISSAASMGGRDRSDSSATARHAPRFL